MLDCFEVGDIVVDSIEALWSRYGGVGGITEGDVREYYVGRERGVAPGVGRVHAFADPLPLAALGLTGPPRSLMYVGHQVLDDLRQRSAFSPRRQDD